MAEREVASSAPVQIDVTARRDLEGASQTPAQCYESAQGDDSAAAMCISSPAHKMACAESADMSKVEDGSAQVRCGKELSYPDEGDVTHEAEAEPEPEAPPALNRKGFPMRPGTVKCSLYASSGECELGARCLFDHPEGASFITGDASTLFVAILPRSFVSRAGQGCGRRCQGDLVVRAALPKLCAGLQAAASIEQRQARR